MPFNNPLPRACSSVAWTKLPDGAVLFSPESEVYYAMNHVGSLIWELLSQEGIDMLSLCVAVQERFPDQDLEKISSDVAELLVELAHNGLVADIEMTAVA